MVHLAVSSEACLWRTRVVRDDKGRLVIEFTNFDRLLTLFTAAAEPHIRLACHTPSALVTGDVPAE